MFSILLFIILCTPLPPEHKILPPDPAGEQPRTSLELSSMIITLRSIVVLQEHA